MNVESEQGRISDEARPANIPSTWIGSPTKTSPGYRWDDPENPGNSVRMFHGIPWDKNQKHHEPFVIVISDGHVLDRNGNPVSDEAVIEEALKHN